jgi:Enterochelin esterase and related enzymes
MPYAIRFSLCFVALLSLRTLALAQAVERSAPSPGPLVHADGRVTFRLPAPRAALVQLWSPVIANALDLRVDGKTPHRLPMRPGDDGVWTLTIGPLPPDRYPYAFDVDGVRTLDWQNPDLVTGQRWPQSFIDVRGEATRYFEPQDVPHGTVSIVPYFSRPLGVGREVSIYTPPGYETSPETEYPVLYLLHGSSGNHRTWVDDGRANYIFDNLIASGSCVPMIVVMPAGHVPPEARIPPAAPPGGAFGLDLLEEVIPLVETRFRIRKDRRHRALAGLSMGAMQAYQIGFRRLDLFSHVAMMSGGPGWGPNVTPDSRPFHSFAAMFPELASAPDELNRQLDLLWIGTGMQDDPERVRRICAEWETLGIRHVCHLSPYDHSFRTWRVDLARHIAPGLFREEVRASAGRQTTAP